MTATPPEPGTVLTPTVLVVDFGAQYAQLIARRVREARVYSEIVPHTMPVAEMLAKQPTAVILSGGPSSVYADGAPQVDPALFDAGVPMFGICYGFQAMALGARRHGRPDRVAEFGGTTLDGGRRGPTLLRRPARATSGLDVATTTRCTEAPDGFTVVARSRRTRPSPRSRTSPAARRRAVPPRGAAQRARPGGARALPLRHRRHRADLDDGQRHRRAGRADPRAGRLDRVICGLSGGVDSAVAAALVHRRSATS